MNPIVVDWQITSRCTRNCEFCYGPQNNYEMKTNEIFKMIDYFKKIGVQVVGITGGDPLTRTDFPDIIQYIKEKDMAVCLSTNADLYNKYRNVILKYVDTIGIPFEGATKEIHDKLRGKGSFESVMTLLDDVSKNSKIKFRIGTVVTEKNFRNLEAIEELLSKYGNQIIYWKLYEYIVYCEETQNKDLKIKNRAELLKIVNSLGQRMNKESIIFDTLEKRSKSYFLIKPNGDVFVPTLNNKTNTMDENVIGNVISDSGDILNKWQNSIDIDGYNCCHRCIYRKDNELKSKYIECSK